MNRTANTSWVPLHKRRTAVNHNIPGAEAHRASARSLLSLLVLALSANCNFDTGFDFAATIVPRNQSTSIEGTGSADTVLHWVAHFADYESALAAPRLPVWLKEGVESRQVDSIGPGYCAQYCSAHGCAAGELVEERIFLVVGQPTYLRGTCRNNLDVSYTIEALRNNIE